MKTLTVFTFICAALLLVGCDFPWGNNEISDIEYIQSEETQKCFRNEIRRKQDHIKEVECGDIPDGYFLLGRKNFPPKEKE